MMVTSLKNKFINSKCTRCEAGFTIIEMLVAMTIAAMFFASFMAVVVATMQTMRTGDQRTVAQQNSRIAINFMADEIKQASELEPPQFTEYRDARTKGLPTSGQAVDLNNNAVYPVNRRSTDGSARGYIDLNHKDASPGLDEYVDFRSDGMPFDVRPLFPNKINFLMNQSAYFPNTRYSSYDPNYAGGIVDLDGQAITAADNFDNAQAAQVRISYEHQKQPPRTGLKSPLLPSDEGALKNLYLTVAGGSGGGVNLFNKPFVLLRNFEIDNVTGGALNDTVFNQTVFQNLNLIDAGGTPLGIQLPAPSSVLRQIIADHVLDVRFRYYHIRGGAWIEIRYDPYTEHMGQGKVQLPQNVNDGYYRYYNQYGEEIFVWATGNSQEKIDIPTTDIVETYKTEYDQDLTFMPTNEFERGLLLFEGWRFVNTVMITVKGSNQELLDTYLRTVSPEISSASYGTFDINNPDFGLGFVDFQKSGSYLGDAEGQNATNPLWHGADSYREGVSTPPGNSYIPPTDSTIYPFDYVDPNMNPNFDPGRFVTLQTMVIPPILQTRAVQAVSKLALGLSYI